MKFSNALALLHGEYSYLLFCSFLYIWNYSKYEHKIKFMDYLFIFIYCSSFILMGIWNKCFVFCESLFLYFKSLVLFIMCHIMLGLNTSEWLTWFHKIHPRCKSKAMQSDFGNGTFYIVFFYCLYTKTNDSSSSFFPYEYYFDFICYNQAKSHILKIKRETRRSRICELWNTAALLHSRECWFVCSHSLSSGLWGRALMKRGNEKSQQHFCNCLKFLWIYFENSGTSCLSIFISWPSYQQLSESTY